MSDSITFRGAFIRYFDVRQEEGGAFTRLHMTADFSTPVIEAMDWADPGRSATDAKLEGALSATHFVLTPGDKSLRQHEIQFDINEAADFKVVAVKENDSTHRELRFLVRTSSAGVAAKLDEYLRRVGDHQGALKIAYVKQQELELGSGKDEGPSTGKPAEIEVENESDTGCVLCNNDIGLDLKDDTRHANGKKCTRYPLRKDVRVKLTGPDGEVAFEGTGEEFKEAASTLASAREANGGTHARRATGRGVR